MKIQGQSYFIQDFQPFFEKKGKVQISPEIKLKVIKSYQALRSKINSGEIIYGLNTGLGALSRYRIPNKDLFRLQVNLVRSHATGTGKPLDTGITRVIIILKVINFCIGFSGVRWEVVKRLQQLINRDILPIIPSQGSVGASGDLAPLAHMALTLIGEGEVHFNQRILPSMVVLKEVGLEPLTLHPKEGLSLINGTQVSTALAILGLLKAQNILKSADIIGAMSVESSLFSRKVFRPEIHKIKRHPGQIESASNVWNLLAGSEIVASHKNCERIQDPYSFRCIPHIHGASRELFINAKRMVENEINSVSDNPIILPDTQEIVTTGHFHAEIIAQALDILAIAMAEIGAISERRIARMLEGIGENIPVFLARKPGIESGYMLCQVTAASLVSENKTFASPTSIDSLPTSLGKEDLVSNAPWAGRKLLNILDNVEKILGIELLLACHIMDLHQPLRPGIGTAIVKNYVRRFIKFSNQDRILSPEIEQAANLIKKRHIVHIIEKKVKLQ